MEEKTPKAAASAQAQPGEGGNPGGPTYRLAPAFLEEIEGEDALAFATQQNEATHQVLETVEEGDLRLLDTLEKEILEVLESPDRIPLATFRGGFANNFWTDETNPRGLWRRQSTEDYLAGKDAWETLLDVDALAEKEGRSWVWHGAMLSYPNFNRALVDLSDGGTDADETREFSLESLDWVEGGFYRPVGKGTLTYIDENTCWLTQPMGEDGTSPSGYPLQARLLNRGQTVGDSQVVFQAPSDAMGVWVGRLAQTGPTRSVIRVAEDFYTSETYVVEAPAHAINETDPLLIPVPGTAQVVVWKDWVVAWLREEWTRNEGGRQATHPAGSLLAFNLEALTSNPAETPSEVLFRPTATEVVEDVTFTADLGVLTTLDNVASRLYRLDPPEGGGTWTSTPLSVPTKSGVGGEPTLQSVQVRAVEPRENNQVWLTTTGFTTPTSLWLVDLDTPEDEGAPQPLLVREAPNLFDAQDVAVTQHFATSKDGTRVPYFEVRENTTPLPAPTLLYGYGGFNISLTPAYAPLAGRAWIGRGGVYVVANIRGGGEFGPEWHTSALKKNRHRAYEDFVAVARDLVARGVTTPTQLAAQGGSNGGLLMGNMYTQYPDDFGAILCQVPLLDMGRYHTLLAGHSWVAEYGDPDIAGEWEFIKTFSPLHLFDNVKDEGVTYPPLMITTSTKDDRVHPYHARAFTHLAQAHGEDVLYYENIEGGHAGAADNRQRAHNQALGWTFLWKTAGARQPGV